MTIIYFDDVGLFQDEFADEDIEDEGDDVWDSPEPSLWAEMSYRKYPSTTEWWGESIEPSEWEVFLKEG